MKLFAHVVFLVAAAMAGPLKVEAVVGQEVAPPSGRLPWEKSPAASEPLLRLPASAAEVLERLGIDESQLNHFTSGEELSASEEEVLAKILYHLPKLGAANVQRWAQQKPDFESMARAPAEHRLDVVRVRGRVKRVSKRPLLEEQAELYEMDHYFLVEVAVDGGRARATIAARRVPVSWKLGEAMDEPAAADALFLKAGKADEGQSGHVLLAASRVEWFPAEANVEGGIGQSQVALAKLGFDAGLWDEVRASERHVLTAGDREAFYQLLAALARDEEHPIRAGAGQEFDLVSLLEKSGEHHGDLGRVRGVARRVTRIAVSDVDVRVRLGIDYYYEIDLFLPLKGASLRLGKDPTGKQNPVYQNAFPATLIVGELPRGMREGDNLHLQVEADAVFFKVWSYRSVYTAQFGQLQPAPMFMAQRARLVEMPSEANWVASVLVSAALLSALGVALLMGWWYWGGERKRRVMAETLDLKL